MKKQKKIAYGILLPVMAAAMMVAGLCVPESEARYVTVASWHTQMYAPESGLSSSLLIKGGHTVMIGEMTADGNYQLPVKFTSTGANMTGTLVCEAVENGEYVTAEFPETLALTKNVAKSVTLTLKPAAIAQEARTETVTVKLQMYWKDDPSMAATLQMDLLPPGKTPAGETPTSGTARDLSNYVKIMEDYARGGLLSMTCTIPDDCTSWRIGMLDKNNQYAALPAGTRYSLDGGKSFRMIPKSTWLALPVNTGAPVEIWFDFSLAGEDSVIVGGIINIAVSGEAAGQWHGKNIFSVNANLDLPGGPEDTEVAVVTRNQPLVLSVPAKWDRTQLEYTITRQGKTSSAPLPKVTVQEGKVTVSASDGLPKAGTYILTLTWKINGLQVAQRQVAVFVNYSVYADPANIPQTVTTIMEGGETA